jgi:hypothetical protein
MKKTDRQKSFVYRDRADHFFKTMQYCAEDKNDPNSPYWNSVGLLAVHSAIALADAIMVAKIGASIEMARRQSIHQEHFDLNAREPIARLLSRELILPVVYFDALWPLNHTHRVDMMAIDRAGAGDLHVVEVKSSLASLFRYIPELLKIPAHYRWLAFDRSKLRSPKDTAMLLEDERLYPSKDMGRIGLIEVYKMQGGIDLGARVVVRPLRFQVRLGDTLRQFRAAAVPDIDYPPE